MDIGILTLPFNNNYGGYLQAYALATVVKDLGHEPTVIFRLQNRRSLLARTKFLIKSLIKKALLRPVPYMVMSQEKLLRRKGGKMLSFVDRNIPLSEPIYSSAKLVKHINQNFDMMIVGSDQCWRPDYGPCITDYFLKSVRPGIKRISYAASFGSKDPVFTENDISSCGKEIAKFVHVSVREQSGLDVIKRFGWRTKNQQVVLDPTLLLPKEHYEKFFKSASPKSGLLSYVLDGSPEVSAIVNAFEQAMSTKAHQIIDPEKWKQLDYTMPSIEDWLKAIHDAEFVVTDSFHGAVFCLLFNTPFAVFANKVRGTERFSTLLDHFGLKSREVEDAEGAKRLINSPIDWDSVNRQLEQKRAESMEYLRNAINN